MKRSASVRFETVLAAGERENAARTLRSAGAAVTSWSSAAGATYAALRVDAGVVPEQLARAAGDGRVDVPALLPLRITPTAPGRLPALAAALGGAGRPRGVGAVRLDGSSLVVELQPATTPLALVVTLIDVELAQFPGRSIEPLLPLDDDVLAAFVRALLPEPDLDASRLIETHLEPLLAAASAAGALRFRS